MAFGEGYTHVAGDNLTYINGHWVEQRTFASSSTNMHIHFEPPPCGHSHLNVKYDLTKSEYVAHCATCGKRAYTAITTDRADALIMLVQDILVNDGNDGDVLLRCWLDVNDALREEKHRLTALVELLDMMRARVERQVVGDYPHVSGSEACFDQRDEQDALGAASPSARAVA